MPAESLQTNNPDEQSMVRILLIAITVGSLSASPALSKTPQNQQKQIQKRESTGEVRHAESARRTEEGSPDQPGDLPQRKQPHASAPLQERSLRDDCGARQRPQRGLHDDTRTLKSGSLVGTDPRGDHVYHRNRACGRRWLADSLGGSFYYLPVGIGLIISGVLLWLRQFEGALLYLLIFLATLIWAWW